MTTSQFFVYRRLISWTLLILTMVWGAYAYRAMPQRQDPVIQVRNGMVQTIYPGADAIDVEQQVSRKIEKKLTENPAVERVRSINRHGLSVVFVDLFDRIRSAEPVWQDLENKLSSMTDLPTVNGQPLRPRLDKDFGDTIALMLTISSPPVSEIDIETRTVPVSRALAEHRARRHASDSDRRYSIVIVHPTTVPVEMLERLSHSLLTRLTEAGLASDGDHLPLAGASALDFELPANREFADLKSALDQWEDTMRGAGMGHPDLWPAVLVQKLETLADELQEVCRNFPGGVARYSYEDLRRFADLIQDYLRQSPRVGKIEQLGVQNEAVYLYYSDRRFATLGLDPLALARQLDQRNINLPGGHLELDRHELVVKPSGEFENLSEIGDVVVSARDGNVLYLRDLVEVVRGYEDPPRFENYRTVGQSTTRAITLAIRHIKGTQIAEFDRDVTRILDSVSTILPADLRIERTSDEPHEVHRKIALFSDSLIEAVLIVVAVSLVFMEWRSALLVAASIPITVAMTLGICHMLGIDLQQISIAALIIALGLLVDDPVVAGDAINREMAQGVPRDVASWLGPQKLARAILYATVTNCVAFLPLLLVSGVVGEFIYSLPVVVTASLVSSRIVSMTFVPFLGYYMLRGQKGMEAGLEGEGRGSRFARLYNGFSELCMEYKWASLGACLLLLAGAGSLIPLIGTAFFPKDLHTTLTVNLFLAEGAPLRETREEALQAVAAIERLAGDEVESYTTFVGAGGPRFWLSVIPEQPASNYAQILIHTRNSLNTSKLAARLKQELPPLVATARVTVEQLETGPPIGVPVQVRIYGDDIATLRRLNGRVQEIMREYPGSDNIHDDWGPESLQLALEVNSDRVRLTGLSHQDLAGTLAGGLSGHIATSLRERDRLIPVMFRLRPDERARMEDLLSLTAMGPGNLEGVPLDEVSRFRMQLVTPKICRRDNERCIITKCDTVPGVLPSRLVEYLETRLREDSANWPAGYRYQFGGEKEEQEKGFASMTVAMVVSVLAIYVALVVQFNSLTKPLVVFAAVPFGMLGGLMGLLLFDVPLGFFAMLGLSSLAGVIISHVIILFEYIEEAHERGEPLRRAVIDAALVRLRPVLVTVLATVGGLIPLALKGGPLWEPLCYVQILGLLAATLVTKVVVPVMYVLFVEDLGLITWSKPGEHKVEGPPAEYLNPVPPVLAH